jgi:hypothetical protein
MKPATILAALAALTLTGCDRLWDGRAPAAPMPMAGVRPNGNGRWTVVPTQSATNAWRIDTRSGALAYCSSENGAVTCTPPDAPPQTETTPPPDEDLSLDRARPGRARRGR